MSRRWDPEKGGTRVELGVVGFRKRVRTRLRGRRGNEEGGESERGKTRPTEMVVTALGQGSVLCPLSKREGDSLVVRMVTCGHTNIRHAHCGCPVCTSDHVLQAAFQVVCTFRDPRGRAEAGL